MEEGGGDVRCSCDLPGMATKLVVLANIGGFWCGSK